MKKEDIEKIKMYLKEYQDKLYSMHETVTESIRLNKNKDWTKDSHAQEMCERAEELKIKYENKISDIDDLISKM